MCLNETYNKFCIGGSISDTFPIHNCLKQRDAFSPYLFSCGVEYGIRKVQQNQKGLEWSGIHLFQVYADNINVLDENLNTIKNTETPLESSREADL